MGVVWLNVAFRELSNTGFLASQIEYFVKTMGVTKTAKNVGLLSWRPSED